jgi:signal transduction histidine kinase
MRWPVRLQLLLPMLSIVVLTIAAASLAVAYWRVDQVRQGQEDNLRRVAATLSDAPFPLNDRVLRQMSGLSGAEFVLVDSGGEIEESTLALEPAEAKTFLDDNAGQEPKPISAGPAVRLQGKNYLNIRVPLTRRLPSGKAGFLTVLYPEDRSLAALKQAAYPSLMAGGAMAVVVILVSSLLGRRLVRPIQRLVKQTAAIAAGDFTPVAVAERDDEIRDLAVSINRMTEQLSRYEEQVRRNERLRALGQLGAGLAHQLRNSATGALMAIELHRSECPSGETSEPLDVALRQLRLMESYVRQFLALGSSKSEPRQSVDMIKLVEEIVGLVRPSCAHAAIELDFSPPAEPLRAWGDAESLGQLLINLLHNAVEAQNSGQPRPAKVIVELHSQADDYILLQVKDNGPGPSAEMQDRLFEPFVTDKPAGTGLGLYMARRIAEAHRGAISWQRTGDMTCFEVRIPTRQT